MSGACEVADTDEHNEDEAFFEEVNCHRDYHIQQSLSGSSSDKLASYNALIQHEDDVAAESPDTGPNGGAYAETFTRSIEGDVAKTIGDERSLGCTGLHSSKDDSIARSPRTLPHSLPPAGGSEEVFEKQDSRGGHVSERSSRSRVHISLASEFRESQATRDIHLLDNRAERENDTCSGLFSLNLDKAFAVGIHLTVPVSHRVFHTVRVRIQLLVCANSNGYGPLTFSEAPKHPMRMLTWCQ